MRDTFLARLHSHSGRRSEKPLSLLPDCGVKASGVWADLGCGDGIFTAVLAELLGPRGRVIGLEKNFSAIRSLERNISDWRPLGHVLPVQADFRDPLPLPKIDGLLAANALHFLPDRRKDGVLRRLGQTLRPGGSMIVVEYNSDRGTGAVPHPLSADAWVERLRAHNFQEVAVASRTGSSYLGEMVAVVAEAG